MVFDSHSQKTPLVVQIEMKPPDADRVREYLKVDDVSSLQQLLKEGTVLGVLRPQPSGPSAETATSLHVAARLDAERCLELLLDHSEAIEALEDPDMTGMTALLAAVEEGRPAALRLLLKAKANVNARDESHRSALHWLVLKLSREQTEEKQRCLQEVVDLLFSADHVNKLDLESHAFLGNLSSATPLAAAADKLHRGGDREPWVPGLRRLCEKLVEAGASISERASKGTTVEQVLKEKGCLTPELLRKRRSPPPRPTAAHVVDVVSMGAGAREVRDVLQGKPELEARAAVNSRLGKDSLLWHAIDKTDASLVEALLDYGADPRRTEITGELPLHCAAYVGHVAIFTQLLEKMKGKADTLDLREHTTRLVRKLMQKGCSTVGLQDADHMACLRRLLQKDVKLDLNQRDTEQTAVQVASAFNNQEAVSELLRCGGALGAQRLVLERPCGTVLDSVLPGTLERAMDGCITHHQKGGGADEAENVVSEDYTLHLDYRFLLPPPPQDTKQASEAVNEMATLMEVCRSRRHRHVILHPLVQTLLYVKWRKALPLYLFNLAVYFFFVVVLTSFVYQLKDMRVLEERLERLQLNGTVDTFAVEAGVTRHQVSVRVLMFLLLVAWLFILLRELFQIKFSREFYLKNIENWLEWFLLVVVLVLCFVPLEVDETRHLAAWAMIVAWYEFVLVLGRAPPLALYITMLRHVSWNFLKLIFLFSALILAFTISFNIILQPSDNDENEDFANFWTTLPKAIVMSTGEFEYSDLSERFPKTVLMTSAVLIFLVFLFLIFLVLMNVMNGLAVTDTQQVVDDARLYSLTSRLELVYLVETFFIKFPYLRRHIGKIQLLLGPDNAPSFLARINKPKKDERLLSGHAHTKQHKLDGDTTECLRVHRLQYVENQREQRRDENAARLDKAVQDLATQHPDLLRCMAAALRSGP